MYNIAMSNSPRCVRYRPSVVLPILQVYQLDVGFCVIFASNAVDIVSLWVSVAIRLGIRSNVVVFSFVELSKSIKNDKIMHEWLRICIFCLTLVSNRSLMVQIITSFDSLEYFCRRSHGRSMSQ